MTKKIKVLPKIDTFLHGGDYSPEQWLHNPEIIEEDFKLMKKANCNTMSIGIFSWAALEPKEGEFDFSWLDMIMDKLAANDCYSVLATPSGAKPVWLAQKYGESLRVEANRVKNLFGMRHNHCYTSPIYRQKIALINQKLAERYKDHPALILWHISNEFEGECHCDLCQNAFREWLKKKYNNDLNQLNQAWWTAFWSHTYSDWSQVESPAPHGEYLVHGQNLDWRRFVTHQTVDFYLHEVNSIKEITKEIPFTTNLHDFVNVKHGYDYWEIAPLMDIVSWDNYPYWHADFRSNWHEGARRAFIHNINRSFKQGQPFLMMESSPSATNWQITAKLRRPGMHHLASLQAVAHGSDSVQYFQWRKSRGSSEKFHGAVVDHCGHDNTRVFREVSQVGESLKAISELYGTVTKAEVAVIYDWQNSWAIDNAEGPRREKKDYELTCQAHYRPFWSMGINTDVISMDSSFDGYKILVAPMLYMVRSGVKERLEKFVKGGGKLVLTYWSGIADENDLCFLGGFPGPLREMAGIWSEELDALYDGDKNFVKVKSDNGLSLKESYEATIFCDLIHAETAEVLAEYDSDFYACRPALTKNKFGDGEVYYIAFRNNEEFVADFYRGLLKESSVKRSLPVELPTGVTATTRIDGDKEYIFVMNFDDNSQQMNFKNHKYLDLITQKVITGEISLAPYDILVLTEQ